MGKKKKNKYEYDPDNQINFDDPDEVLAYLNNLKGGTDDIPAPIAAEATTFVPPRKNTAKDSIESTIASMIKGQTPGQPVVANSAVVLETSVKKYECKTPMPRYNTIPVDQQESSESDDTEQHRRIKVKPARHDYGFKGCGIRIMREALMSDTLDATVTIPVYEYDADVPNTFGIVDDQLADTEFDQALYDVAVLTALRFRPDAVYPYNPEGIERLMRILDQVDLDEVTCIVVDGSIQCYFTQYDEIQSNFINSVHTILASKFGFRVDRLQLIYDMIPTEDSPYGVVRIPYAPDRCNKMNQLFEARLLESAHLPDGESNTITDLGTVLADPNTLFENILTDIYMVLSPKLDNAVGDDTDDEYDDDYEGEDGEFEPYGIAEESEGGASNDNAPFPTYAEPTSSKEQGTDPTGTDAQVAAQEVREVPRENAGRREYNSGDIGTNIGEILKSKGYYGPAGGNTRGSGTDAEEVEEKSESGVQVHGRGSDGSEQKQKEEAPPKEKEENGSMVINVTTVGRS